ncbi:hypothetical protein Cgig2_010908 [Carnegiea gigantea]|uniref:EF-hand domain-containing protein n=1 Tax=Carnegiea gigantea TaxID=171969 RepID=A0A9Q1JIZ8_9CARY|nr:hypothetical protein Cgig2_010908 [Carnegiea gigantea]
MSGYPHNPPGYGYGYNYPYSSPQHQPYGQSPTAQPYGQPPTAQPYGGPSAPPYGAPPDSKPPKENNPYGGPGPAAAAASSYPPPAATTPFASLLPSTFPPGTDPNIIACFQVADQDGSGMIDDKELQRALSTYNQAFSLRTVRLLMYLFTNSNARKIGPKEFISLFYCLESWREIFERFDRDRSGKIDAAELRDALYSLGFAVSPIVLDLLVSKFDKTGGKCKAIEYDNFIEYVATLDTSIVVLPHSEGKSAVFLSFVCDVATNILNGLTEKFKAKDKAYNGTATFSYEEFMLSVLPFLVA